MTRPDALRRREDADTRTVVRPGDPGIDDRWLRRRTLGMAVASGWLVAATLGIGAMTASQTGPPGWIEAWQLRDHGTANPLLAALPFLPLVFLPRLAGLLPIDERRPFRLGLQQAWKPGVGPRLEWPAERLQQRASSVYRVALAVLFLGLVGMAMGATWAWTEATKAIGAPVPVSYEDVAAGRAPGTLVVVTGAHEGNARWVENTHLRTSTIHDEWRDMRPGSSSVPSALVERMALDVDADGRAREFARPGLIGRVSPLDAWHAGLLRREGFALASHAWVLKRSISADTDGLDDADPGIVLGLAGLVATFLGGTFAFAARRRLATFPSRRMPMKRHDAC